jgi:hypothetical protein
MSTKPNSLYVLRAAECGMEHLYRRGKRGTYYVRKRIPSDFLDTYRAGKKELTVSLKTSDARLAKVRLHTELAAMEAEFARRRQKLAGVPGQPARQELRVLSPELLDGLAAAWLRSMLHGDEACRQAGLSDGEFEDLGAELFSTRADLGTLLARGNVSPILPAFRTLLHLHGFDAELDEDDLRRGAYRLLRTVVAGLDQRLQRQAGHDVPTPAPPVANATAQLATWEACLQAWSQRNAHLGSETFYAMQTAWRSLRAFAEGRGVPNPGLVTQELVADWATHRRFTEGRAAPTVNEQRRKLHGIYLACVRAKLVATNPVVDIETFKATKRGRRWRGVGCPFQMPIFATSSHTRSSPTRRRGRVRSGTVNPALRIGHLSPS